MCLIHQPAADAISPDKVVIRSYETTVAASGNLCSNIYRPKDGFNTLISR